MFGGGVILMDGVVRLRKKSKYINFKNFINCYNILGIINFE